MKLFFFLLFCLTGILSCSHSTPFEKQVSIEDYFFKGLVKLERMEKMKKYKLSIWNAATGKKDVIYTPYEVFQLETGDINHDGKTDICLGIIKPTPFDPVLKKRLFLFQIDRNYIRPLWLSSRLVNPLEEFSVRKDSLNEIVIHTLEKKNQDLYCTRVYKWSSFGMHYLTTTHDSITYDEGRKIIQ